MRWPRFLLCYLVVAAISGLAGLAGSFLLVVVLGGVRAASVWDVLSLVQIGGVTAAAVVFHLACHRVLGEAPLLAVEILLFAGVQAGLPFFFDVVVRSDLTGGQGIAMVVAALLAAGAALARVSAARPRPARIAKVGAA